MFFVCCHGLGTFQTKLIPGFAGMSFLQNPKSRLGGLKKGVKPDRGLITPTPMRCPAYLSVSCSVCSPALTYPSDRCLYLSAIFSGSQQEIFGTAFALYRQKIFIIPLEKPADSLTSQPVSDVNNEFMICVEYMPEPNMVASLSLTLCYQ